MSSQDQKSQETSPVAEAPVAEPILEEAENNAETAPAN